MDGARAREIEWISKKSSSAIRFHFSLSAQSEGATRKKRNGGSPESFAPFTLMPSSFQFLLFLRLLRCLFRISLIFNNAKCEWQNGEFSSCKPKRCILLPIVVYSYISDAVAMNAEKIYSFAVHSGCVVWCPIQHAFIDWKFTVFPIYRNLYRLGGRRSADCTIYSNQLSESEVKTASHCHTPMSFGSVPLQLWCALLSNWEWDETHNGVKYIGRYFQFPSERDKGSSSSTLSLSHCTPSRFPCRANDAITGFRWQILMLTCTARTCRIILPLPSTLSRQK